MISLSKIIAPKKKTVVFKWLRKDVLVYNEAYRTARSRMRKPLNKCFWCRHPFIDGEHFAVGCVEGQGNKVLCHQCADAALMEVEKK